MREEKNTAPAAVAGPDDSELEDLAHAANQEALSFGVSLDVFLRLAKTVRSRSSTAPTTQAAPVAQGDAEDASDTTLLNILADEYLDLRAFSIPTGQGDADVGWRVIQHHMGVPTERVVSEVYKDDLRSAIRAAIVRLKRDPYCTGALHEEDAARSQAKKGKTHD